MGYDADSSSRSRQQYMARLGILQTSSSANVSKKLSASVTLLLLDWDDTLFCTSALRTCSLEPGCSELLRLEDSIKSFLRTCKMLGETVVITNAQHTWVESCIMAYLPGLTQEFRHVRVLSARDRYEARFPHDPVAWKCETFAELKENSSQIANLIAVGDQQAEMTAVTALAKAYRTSYVKTVRLIQQPTVEELIKQLNLIRNKLPKIVGLVRHINITMRQKNLLEDAERETNAKNP